MLTAKWQPSGSGCPAGQARVYSPTFGPFPGANSVLAFRGTVAVRFDRNVATGRDYDGSAREVAPDFDGFFNFPVGGLYWNEDAEQVARSINLFCIPALPPGIFGPFSLPASSGTLSANLQITNLGAIARPNGREIRHTSVYGQVELSFARIWRSSAEVRCSDERGEGPRRELLPRQRPAGGGGFPGSPPTTCADISLAGSETDATSTTLGPRIRTAGRGPFLSLTRVPDR